MDHLLYGQKIGIDHVGISSDFDGGGGIGWNDASETMNVTLPLEKEVTGIRDKTIMGRKPSRVLDEFQV
ncbi:MAG: hypothetical protein CM15mP109_13610 [Candidatus Dadabacteria bacterium]|nr:MAG: hypothetical protein CM15mP109_13610 [Candidatus Dadabacteria bacterium]